MMQVCQRQLILNMFCLHTHTHTHTHIPELVLVKWHIMLPSFCLPTRIAYAAAAGTSLQPTATNRVTL